MRIARMALAAVLVAPACDNASTAEPTPNVISFAQDVQPIFTASCAGCHTGVGTSLPGALNLSAGPAAHAGTVNVRAVQTDTSTLLDRIEPGDPEASYLVHKLQGTHTATTVRGRGGRMPAGCPTWRACLTPANIQLIRQWIVEGAANN